MLVCFNPSELRNPFLSLSPQRGYDDLQTIVPTCQQQDFSIGSQKLSKAIVLQKSMARENTGGVGTSGAVRRLASYPLSAWPWWGGYNGRVGYGERANKISLVLLVDTSSVLTPSSHPHPSH